MWTLAGDADGLHVLVADAASGYSWQTAASLSEPGFDADQWIGNACVTGSGQRLAVVYAPRTFTNKEELFARGGFVAIVDLTTGATTKLPIQTSLAYFNPGCGVDESAVVTQEGSAELAKTRVLRIDTASATLGAPIEVPGQLTSAVPVKDGIVAADSHSLVHVNAKGTRTLYAPSTDVPFRVTSDADGGVVYLDKVSGKDVAVRRALVSQAKDGKPALMLTTLASGPLSQLSLARGSAGKVFLTGTASTVAPLPPSVASLAVPAKAEVSTLGEAAITRVQRAGEADPRAPTGDPLRARPVQLDVALLGTGRAMSFTVDPDAHAAPRSQTGRTISPRLAPSGTAAPAEAGSPHDPVDADRWCAVPRGDPGNQVLQPKPRQVEWAIDQAVRGVLNVQRPANWKNLSMPAYTPQGLFPRLGLDGGGFVPAQIMLGIAAQESNLWQASRVALPGVTANPLISNFYGRPIYDADPGNDWVINWSKADCGYGVTQVTDGMRLAGHQKPGETLYPYQTQRAVALDFAANIAAGLQILENKWNQVRREGMQVNDGDPKYIENWFFAIWAYNSGFHPLHYPDPWGVGWANNPINPHFPPDRTSFLEHSYDDARHPGDWPYAEKVIGFAGHPIQSVESPGQMVAGYRQAWWLDGTFRITAKPPVNFFCNQTNDCFPGTVTPDRPSYPGDPGTGEGDVRGEPAGPCFHRANTGEYDLKCWFHMPARWKDDCSRECGRELLRFDPGYAYQEDGTSYPPNCGLAGLPDNALIIDNVPDWVAPVRPNCDHPWTNSGSFALDFAPGPGHLYSSKVDFHQAGGGFGGHFWFGHTRKPYDDGGIMKVTGTWSLNRALIATWARVLVHLPDQGAWAQQAKYNISLGNGTVRTRYLNQNRQANNWVSLGVYNFDGYPQITLDTVTNDGRGTDDIAWDAIAFQPLPRKPYSIVAALGDSYISGEGSSAYYKESDSNHGTLMWNACRRTANAYPRRLFGSDVLATSQELAFVACSGAHSWNVDGTFTPTYWADPDSPVADGQFGEMSQVQSGALSEDTTLVLLSLGGNDRNAFVQAIGECAVLICTDNDYLPTYKNLIDLNQVDIARAIHAAHGAAPNAMIMLVGYPWLFSKSDPTCSGLFTNLEIQNLNDLADYMAEKQKATVARLITDEHIGVYFADGRQAIGPDHGVCSTSDEQINGVRLGANGEGDFHVGDPDARCWWFTGGNCISREGFHPKLSGHSSYTDYVFRRLIEVGYYAGEH